MSNHRYMWKKLFNVKTLFYLFRNNIVVTEETIGIVYFRLLRAPVAQSVATGCQSRSCEMELKLGQYYFRKRFKATRVICLPQMGLHSMWKRSHLLGKTVMCSNGVRKSGNTCVGWLATMILLNKLKAALEPQSINWSVLYFSHTKPHRWCSSRNVWLLSCTHIMSH